MSPDLAQMIEMDTSVSDLREITYTYDGEVLIKCVLSAFFASMHGIEGSATFDLPDEYPIWHKELTIVCERCWDLEADA